MRKAFTLVEMLIVVVVLVTLMSITFRLTSVGDDQTDRGETISRMQRLENCLSGYYAAFGTYPPVRNHAHSNLERVNDHGMQNGEDAADEWYSWYKDSGNHGMIPNGGSSSDDWEGWKIVRALCMRQPVAARFPYPENYNEYLEAISSTRDDGARYDDGYTNDPGRHDLSVNDWQECQIFQFGLMSFLLPRYLFMMSSGENAKSFYTEECRQWYDNNSLPCNPATGVRYSDWSGLKDAMTGVISGYESSKDPSTCFEVSMLPSQIVCRRWLPNLQNMCYTGIEFSPYGVDISDDDTQRLDNDTYDYFVPGGANGGGGAAYQLDLITVTDGWNNEFFYYSPPPYQSYVLWSSGPNGRTFPPWISRDDLPSEKAKKAAALWIEDDLVNMSN